jgi:hypothetical protein
MFSVERVNPLEEQVRKEDVLCRKELREAREPRERKPTGQGTARTRCSANLD